jgi:hypothetical protein
MWTYAVPYLELFLLAYNTLWHLHMCLQYILSRFNTNSMQTSRSYAVTLMIQLEEDPHLTLVLGLTSVNINIVECYFGGLFVFEYPVTLYTRNRYHHDLTRLLYRHYPKVSCLLATSLLYGVVAEGKWCLYTVVWRKCWSKRLIKSMVETITAP